MTQEIEHAGTHTHIHIHIGGGGEGGGVVGWVVFLVIFVALAVPIISKVTGVNMMEMAQSNWNKMQHYLPRFQNMSSVLQVPVPPTQPTEVEVTAGQATPTTYTQPSPRCEIGRMVVKRGLVGKSRLVADGNWDMMLKEMLKDTSSTICHEHCIMRLQDASQVMLFNDNTYMRLVGNWMSTGLSCGEEEEIADNQRGNSTLQQPTEAHQQKAVLILAPLYKGYEYAAGEIKKRLAEPGTTQPTTGQVTAGVWSYLPESVQALGWKAVGIILILTLILTNFTGGVGKLVAVILIAFLGWLVFY